MLDSGNSYEEDLKLGFEDDLNISPTVFSIFLLVRLIIR